MKKYFKYILLFSLLLLLSSCAEQPVASQYGPGFWVGLWHGISAPFAFIGSIFMDIRVYEFPNSGFFYDFGFILGVSIIFGGAGSAR